MEYRLNEGSRIADLKSRYGGRIRADVRGDAAAESSVIVLNLMNEWNPIYALVSDLKAIMGTPSKEQSAVLEYVFDNGRDGDLWRFTVLDDIVVGVEWVPLD